MNMSRQHFKENLKRIRNGEQPREYPRYLKGPHLGGNRHTHRAKAAQLRHKADTPHGAQKRKPRGWYKRLKAKRKLGRR